MKRKTINCLKVFTFLIIAVCALCVSACNNEQNTDKTVLIINKKEIVLEFLGQTEIDYSYNGTETPVITVADESIVAINGKTISAKKSGKTTITITAGELSDSCSVTVNAIKEELFSVDVEESLFLFVDESKEMSAVLKYDQKEIVDATISYEGADDDIVTLQGNNIKANKLGTTQVIVTGSYQNYSKNKIINVTVTPIGSVEFIDKKIELYPVANYGGQDYTNKAELKYLVKEKGNVIENANNIEYDVDNANVRVENGYVIAQKVGESTVTIKYTGSDGVEVSSQIKVIVSLIEIKGENLPVLNLTKNKTQRNSIVLADYFDKNISASEVKSSVITDGVISNDVVYQNGKIDCSGILFDGECSLILATDKVKCSIPVFMWTDAIENVDGLKSLQMIENGYYYLTSDIDMSATEWADNGDGEFKGVLDGKDLDGKIHVVNNFNASCGLFNSLGNGAEIRNITFNKATLNSSAENAGIIADSIVSGATVTMKTLSISAIIDGTNCGGVVGSISSSGKVNFANSYLNIYAPKHQTTNGAFVGGADGTVNFDTNDKVYTSLNLCGDGKTETINNSSKNSINELSKISPVKASEETISFNIVGGTQTVSLEDVPIGARFNLFASGHRSGTISSEGKLELLDSDIQGFSGDHIEVFVNSSSGIKYYTFDVTSILEITSIQTFEYLKQMETGKVTLKTDIDYNGAIWESVADFKGEFDGQGHTIKNIQFKGCGLFKSFGGKLNNLVMQNVVLDGVNSAAIAATSSSKCEFSNIYIQFGDSVNVNAWGTLQGGLIERINSDADVLTVKDSIIIKNEANIWFGYVSGYKMGTANLQNVYFVGPNELLRADRDTATGEASEGSTYAFYTDMKDLHDDIHKANSTIQLSEVVVNAFDKVCNESFVYISNTNKQDLLDGSKINGKTVYLSGDIDLTGVAWNTTVAFSGILDGQGYSINGLSLESGAGLFKSVKGTIKNIVINYASEKGSTGAIAHTMDGALTLENVYINLQVRSGFRFGGIVHNVQTYLLTLNNVVIDLPQSANAASCALIAGNAVLSNIKMTNTYLVGGTGNFAGAQTNEAVESYIKEDGYEFYSTVSEFYADVVNDNAMPQYIKDVAALKANA